MNILIICDDFVVVNDVASYYYYYYYYSFCYSLRSATFLSVAQSERHLFAGTSRAAVRI